ELERARYPWLLDQSPIRPLDRSFPAPRGFRRVEVHGFGAWLRELPLRPQGTPVRSYRGDVLVQAMDPRIAAVADLDVAPRDLQQCADTVIRLHAEWLWASGRPRDIRYHVTSGDVASWSSYSSGQRPKLEGNKLVWVPGARGD